MPRRRGETPPDCTTQNAQGVDAAGNSGNPVPLRLNLSTAAGVRRELARVYRDARSGALDAQDATRLGYLLMQIAKMIELGDLERRLEALESTAPAELPALPDGERASRRNALLADARLRRNRLLAGVEMAPTPDDPDTWEVSR